jgi:hypothetical protein
VQKLLINQCKIKTGPHIDVTIARIVLSSANTGRMLPVTKTKEKAKAGKTLPVLAGE